MKKVELHCHLDGSVNISSASKILGKDSSLLKSDMIANDKCVDLNEYLTKFDVPINIMQTKENLTLICKELISQFKNDEVIYAEVRFAPMFHMNEGLSMDEVVKTVIDGLKDDGVKVNVLLCMMRHLSFEENRKVIDVALKYLGKGVCGIDLAGAEGIFKTSAFEELFMIAKEKGIPYTIHAGEADGADSVHDAIRFGAKRIGHGIRSIEDENVMDLLRDNIIFLEVCPTSNVQTNAINEYKDHPIKKLFDYGIKLNINTDNRTVSNINLNKEYELCSENFGFTDEEYLKMNIDAINASFISEEEKEKFKNILTEK